MDYEILIADTLTSSPSVIVHFYSDEGRYLSASRADQMALFARAESDLTADAWDCASLLRDQLDNNFEDRFGLDGGRSSDEFIKYENQTAVFREVGAGRA